MYQGGTLAPFLSSTPHAFFGVLFVSSKIYQLSFLAFDFHFGVQASPAFFFFFYFSLTEPVPSRTGYNRCVQGGGTDSAVFHISEVRAGWLLATGSTKGLYILKLIKFPLEEL